MQEAICVYLILCHFAQSQNIPHLFHVNLALVILVEHLNKSVDWIRVWIWNSIWSEVD